MIVTDEVRARVPEQAANRSTSSGGEDDVFIEGRTACGRATGVALNLNNLVTARVLSMCAVTGSQPAGIHHPHERNRTGLKTHIRRQISRPAPGPPARLIVRIVPPAIRKIVSELVQPPFSLSYADFLFVLIALSQSLPCLKPIDP